MRMVAMVAALGLFTVAAAPPPGSGTVAVRLIDHGTDDAGDDQPFADAVGQTLGEQDFTLLPDHSRYVAEVSVSREDRGIVTGRATRDPASIGVGSWGPAISVPLGSRKTVLHDLVATTLTVRLVTRQGHTPLWSGSAVTAAVDGAPVAAKLARAAFAAYPQTMAAPASVP